MPGDKIVGWRIHSPEGISLHRTAQIKQTADVITVLVVPVADTGHPAWMTACLWTVSEQKTVLKVLIGSC